MNWILEQTWLLPLVFSFCLLINLMWHTLKPVKMGGNDKVNASDALSFFVIGSLLAWGGWWFYHIVMFVSYYVWKF
jgi:hypothetical protein